LDFFVPVGAFPFFDALLSFDDFLSFSDFFLIVIIVGGVVGSDVVGCEVG